MSVALERSGIQFPSAKEAEVAERSSRALERLLAPMVHGLVVDVGGETLVLPKAVVSLLHKVLAEMAAGNAVSIVPVHAELTTQEAANFLNVSRPYLIQLLESNVISFSKVGTHRRVKLQDLQAYKARLDTAREVVLAQLVAEGQALKQGY